MLTVIVKSKIGDYGYMSDASAMKKAMEILNDDDLFFDDMDKWKGLAGADDLKDAFAEIYEKALSNAEKGIAHEQYTLGKLYYSGIGTAQSDLKAYKWLSQGAEKNDADAQYLLGNFYIEGISIKKGYRSAVKWYRKASEQGHRKAMVALAKCYEDGIGVEVSQEKADAWMEKSAKQ